LIAIVTPFMWPQDALTQNKMEKATFGSGCFWCSEAIFSRVEGVEKALPGYAGGTEPNPSYELVCSGKTRYAEVTQVTFDPGIISYEMLLKIFFETHDPTTLNRQGADVGPQYRSIIFYHNEDQKRTAENIVEELTKAKIWDQPIVTEIEPFEKFYLAEKYHINYYENNPGNGYCNFVITPKVNKFEKVFKDYLK
jgi:peptide-methionine (S)-S-oxide reductase